jgi:hypothetical protein
LEGELIDQKALAVLAIGDDEKQISWESQPVGEKLEREQTGQDSPIGRHSMREGGYLLKGMSY